MTTDVDAVSDTAPEAGQTQRQASWSGAILAVAIIAGLLLTIIGVRFLIWPEQAAHTFGLSRARSFGYQLHAVIALRDLWLGALALAFAWLRDWRALALWLGMGAFVCFGDAGIVFGATGKPQPLAFAFHMVSGMICAYFALLAYGRHARSGRGTP